jgi:hypothetical protein
VPLLSWWVGPGHYHVLQHPQDVAWLSAVRYAQKGVFMSVPLVFVGTATSELYAILVKPQRLMRHLLLPVLWTPAGAASR